MSDNNVDRRSPPWIVIIILTTPSAGLPAGVMEVRVYDGAAPFLIRTAYLGSDTFDLGSAYWMYSSDGADWIAP